MAKATRIRIEADCPRCGTLIQLRHGNVGFVEIDKTCALSGLSVAHSQVCPLCYDIVTIEFSVGSVVSEVIAETDQSTKELTPKKKPVKRKVIQPQTKKNNKRHKVVT